MTNSNSPPGSHGCDRCGHRCPDDRLVYDIPDVQRLLGNVSRRFVETLIRTGQLKSYKVGGLRKVDRAAVDEYLRNSIAPEYLAATSR